MGSLLVNGFGNSQEDMNRQCLMTSTKPVPQERSFVNHTRGHEAGRREHCATIITHTSTHEYSFTISLALTQPPTPRALLSERERWGEMVRIKTWGEKTEKKAHIKYETGGNVAIKGRSNARQSVGGRQEGQTWGKREKRLWRGKRQRCDLLMQNWGILTADSKCIPTACKY